MQSQVMVSLVKTVSYRPSPFQTNSAVSQNFLGFFTVRRALHNVYLLKLF
jgi:hypothetical protein